MCNDSDWITKDNIACIINYVNRHRFTTALPYLEEFDVVRMIEIYAQEKSLSYIEASEELKRKARYEGEKPILQYIQRVSPNFKPLSSKTKSII